MKFHYAFIYCVVRITRTSNSSVWSVFLWSCTSNVDDLKFIRLTSSTVCFLLSRFWICNFFLVSPIASLTVSLMFVFVEDLTLSVSLVVVWIFDLITSSMFFFSLLLNVFEFVDFFLSFFRFLLQTLISSWKMTSFSSSTSLNFSQLSTIVRLLPLLFLRSFQ